jgi:acyl-CoA thioester hydrolase
MSGGSDRRVRYEVGLFAPQEAIAGADGHFVHVFVDRASNRPAPTSSAIRAALEAIRIGG